MSYILENEAGDSLFHCASNGATFANFSVVLQPAEGFKGKVEWYPTPSFSTEALAPRFEVRETEDLLEAIVGFIILLIYSYFEPFVAYTDSIC